MAAVRYIKITDLAPDGFECDINGQLVPVVLETVTNLTFDSLTNIITFTNEDGTDSTVDLTPYLTQIGVTSTEAIALTLTGDAVAGWALTSSLVLDPNPDNIAQITPDGLLVECCPLPPRIFDVAGQTMVNETFSGIHNPVDFDLDGSIVNYSFTVQPPVSEGVFVFTDAASGEFDFIPAANFVGESCVTVVATDDTGLTDDAIYCVTVNPLPIMQCVNIGSTDTDGNFSVIGSGEVEEDAKFERIVQYSADGVIWESPVSYAGGASFIPINTGDAPLELTFAGGDFDDPMPAAGAYIRECIRVIGTAFEFCDTKQFPAPSVAFDALSGNINLQSAGDTANECFTGQDLTITVKGYDSNYALLESWTSAPYDPAVEAPDLSTLPTLLAGTVTNGANNTTLAYNSAQTDFVHVEVDLTAQNNYACPTGCSGSLSFDTTSATDAFISPVIECAACFVDFNTILDGTYISIADPNSIVTNPAHMGNVKLDVFTAAGQPVVTFAAGTLYDVAAGHYPMNSGTSYPLTGGDYYYVITTPTCEILCGNFTVEQYDICANSVQINYNGLTSGSGFVYQLPVQSGMTEIEFALITQSIPDQLVIRYEGAIIYDSGQVSTGAAALTDTVPFAFNADSFIEVEVVPDPTQPPLTVTIYSLSVGCCLLSDPITLPYRDPFTTVNFAGCGFGYGLTVPYIDNGIVNSPFKVDLNEITENGCVTSLSDVNINGTGGNIGCTLSRQQFFNCIDNSLPAFVAITSQSASQIVIDFDDAVNFAAGSSFINALLAEAASLTIPDNYQGFREVQIATNLNVNCGDDGTAYLTQKTFIHPSMFQFIAGQNRIIIDNTLPELNPTECCQIQQVDSGFSDAAFQRWANVMANVGSTSRRLWDSLNDAGGGTETCVPFTYGIISTPYTHTNNVQQYTLCVNTNTQEWSFYRGVDNTGFLLMTQDEAFTGGNAIYGTNEDGLIVQEINYSTAVFDLTYYAGGQYENFADGEELRARMEALTGQTWDYISHYDVLVRTSGSGTLANITVTNP